MAATFLPGEESIEFRMAGGKGRQPRTGLLGEAVAAHELLIRQPGRLGASVRLRPWAAAAPMPSATTAHLRVMPLPKRLVHPLVTLRIRLPASRPTRFPEERNYLPFRANRFICFMRFSFSFFSGSGRFGQEGCMVA